MCEDMLIRGARVVDPVTGFDGVEDILIRGGVIAQTGQGLTGGGARIIDARGLTAAPGLMDGHVHFRDPEATAEDIYFPRRGSGGPRRLYHCYLYGEHGPSGRQCRHAPLCPEKRRTDRDPCPVRGGADKRRAGRRERRYEEAWKRQEPRLLPMTASRSWMRGSCLPE